MAYQETLRYLESFINYEKLPSWPYKESFKLERFTSFLRQIGNPQRSLRCVHVAGTKGKGSTCAFISYILRQAGFKVGLYTSPHLSDFRERIRILLPGSAAKDRGSDFEGMISPSELVKAVVEIRPDIEKFNLGSRYGPLSFFEIYTAIAFRFFKRKKVDFVVLETGLGGRLDATNTVSAMVSAITPISYEHTQKLGKTLKEIATEKAGIIKCARPKAPHSRPSASGRQIVISAPQERVVARVIYDRCKEAGARLFVLGKDITVEESNNGEFAVRGIKGIYRGLKTSLLGRHQLVNSALAIGITEALAFNNINIDPKAIKYGLLKTRWPGRCEVISKNPFLILDGAQNVASALTLNKAIKDNFIFDKLILVFGISKDKDIAGVCSELKTIADTVILTRADNPRASEPKDLKKHFPGKDVYLTSSVQQALKLSREKAKRSSLILVTGSLFVVGEARRLCK